MHWGKTIPLILFLIFFFYFNSTSGIIFPPATTDKALAKIVWNLVVISLMTLSSRKVSIKKRSILRAFVECAGEPSILTKQKTIQNNTETHKQKNENRQTKTKSKQKTNSWKIGKKGSAIVNLQVDLRSIGTSDVGFRYANFVSLNRLLASIKSRNFVEEGGPIIKYDGLIGEGKTAQFCFLYWYQRIIHLAFSTITV